MRARARVCEEHPTHTLHFTSRHKSPNHNLQNAATRLVRVCDWRWLLGLRLSPGEIRIGRIMLCGYHQYSLRRRIRGIRATATLIDNRDGHNHHQARGEGRRWGE